MALTIENSVSLLQRMQKTQILTSFGNVVSCVGVQQSGTHQAVVRCQTVQSLWSFVTSVMRAA